MPVGLVPVGLGIVSHGRGFVSAMAASFPTNQAIVVGGGLGGGFVLRLEVFCEAFNRLGWKHLRTL